MKSFKQMTNISGWLVFAISFVVYIFSVESTGSLWDCGEFILGAYKLQVVHPPGAPTFVVFGRFFALLGEWFSSNPSAIAVGVNLMSALCTAFAAMFTAWITIILAKMALYGREEEPTSDDRLALGFSGLVAGLSTAFASSIWFSAVEGEVYAMSTFFTALTLWAMVKWYHLPNNVSNDRWILFAVFSAGLSIGVHLLSLLTFPALALFYYYKKYSNPNLKGAILAALAGVGFIAAIQTLIITGLPGLWVKYELMMVNGLGMPFHSGLIPLILTIAAAFYLGIRFAHKRNSHALQLIVVGGFLVTLAFSMIGIVVIRANANPPVNMNDNYDAMRLLPYLNREQYGERPLLKGPLFDAEPIDTDITDRYGRVGDRYEVVDYKINYKYRPSDEVFFPRMGHYSENHKRLYRVWMGGKQGRPTMSDNLSYFFRYQINWMYWRYFMWNFAGRQNGQQGYLPSDPSSGHWLSGIPFIDSNRLYNQSKLPTAIKEDPARNKYFLLPLLFGILGLLFHFRNRRKDFFALMVLFIITGIGIIVYTNQPPQEPRERDYVLVGSFMTFAMWIGMGVFYLLQLLRDRFKLSGAIAVPLAGVLVLSAPVIMGFQNFDDHSRMGHTAARDYASNFLNSCEPNAIIFTYGDNDTYPLWYAQEVEGIRRDVRVVNLSLIAVDWYINQMKRKVNDSEAIKFTVPSESIRGYLRNQIFYYSPDGQERDMELGAALRFIGESHPLKGGSRQTESYLPSRNLYINIDRQKAVTNGIIDPNDPEITDRLEVKINGSYITKDDLAVLDIIYSNIHERPVYFSVTCPEDKMYGLGQHMQLEGLGLRILPIRTNNDRSFRVFGNGRVDAEKFITNVTEKFRWGNFDKHKTFVDRSYTASVYSMKMILLRSAYDMLRKGKKEEAVKICEQMFSAFPHFNFPYDGTTMAFINIMNDADAYTKAKPYMEIMAKHVAEYQEFYASLRMADLENGFMQDKQEHDRLMLDLMRVATDNEDDAFYKQMQEWFGPYVDESAIRKQLMQEMQPEFDEE
jgi:hypothetical protein